MAKVKDNLMIRGLSGTLGKQFVIRQMKDGSTIISAKPDFSHREFSEGQLSHQCRFKQAKEYAKVASKTHPIYAELAKEAENLTAYNIALSDWFHSPVIHSITQEGALVRVEASDNVMVSKVMVTVLDEQGNILDQGDGVRGFGDSWEYTLQQNGKVLVEVWDLAGNRTANH